MTEAMPKRKEQKAYDEEGGVSIRTWIGTPGPPAQSHSLSEISKQTAAVHFVLLECLKTYPVKVTVRGSIESEDPKLRFEGGSAKTSYEWAILVRLFEERRCLNDVYV